MIHYLIVILEHDSAPFCCYDVKERGGPGLIPLDVLEKSVSFAIKNAIPVNFLCGNTALPPGYEELIASVDHVRMVPLARARSGEEAVFIIDGEEDLAHAHVLETGGLNNVILRVGKSEVPSLPSTVERLLGRFRRLNVILKEPGGFAEEDFSAYADALEDVRRILAGEYRKGSFLEISTLSDRVFLTNMNNCNAGTAHLTVAPNGRFYLCPAFYYENGEDCLAGPDDAVEIRNARLLTLENAPVCRNCDAWHCKRCVWLNRRLTSELNTPSHEQCVLAHLEREASRRFLEEIGRECGLNDRVTPIPKLDYLDPFDIISDRSRSPGEKEEHFARLLSRPLEDVPVSDLLRQIYTLDPGMLARLKELNSAVVDLEDGQ
ncbi:MAG TPA: CXXX repeat peptide maturase [Syntrophorhabdaceae bacterium]|nr:CXXX repeat peptide maturase [Syntrophorhabdaceae bacterium]HOD76340.1 CXXX repeat peptide maturase [Syntrophorhabdaceae bacterium]